MPEFVTEVKTFKVEYMCDECTLGNMRPTGKTLLSAPPRFPHKCTACGASRTFTSTYPYQVQKEID